MDPISLAVIAGSALLKYQANRQAQQRQERLRQSMEAFQRVKAREQEAAAEQMVSKQTPAARAEEMQKLTDERSASLRDTVAATTPAATQIAGKLSPDYERSQEAMANTVSGRTKRAIEQLAVLGAPGEVQHKFGIRFGRSAGTVDAATRASSNVGNAYMNDIDNVRPNPIMSMAGDVGMAVGTGLALRGGGGAAPTDPYAGTTYGDTSETTGGPPPSWRTRLSRGFGLWG